MQLCPVIPKRPHDIYLKEAFREGWKTKVKMAIINLSWKTLADVVELTIMIEEEMLVRKKSIARYHRDSNSDVLEYFDEEEKWRPKKKETK